MSFVLLTLLAVQTEPPFGEHRLQITLNPDISEDIDGYRALIRITDEGVFSGAMPHGEDLDFRDASGARLPFEVVSWDRKQHLSEIWVRVGALNASAPTRLELRYGRAREPNPRFRGYRAHEVWAEDYDLVLHGNLNAGKHSGTDNEQATWTGVEPASAGIVGQGLAFDGSRSNVRLPALQHVGKWMTPRKKIGNYEMRRPQGLANDGRHFYFATHNDPRRADILKISRATGKRVQTFAGAGPLHSAGGDYWPPHGTLVFSTGGRTTPAKLEELTVHGERVATWDLSAVGFGRGALCAWKSDNRWLLLTSTHSKFTISEVLLQSDGRFQLLHEWTSTEWLGTPQGMDYFGGRVYYYADGGLTPSRRTPALITQLRLDVKSAHVEHVDQHAILLNNNEAEGLTILDDGTLVIGDAAAREKNRGNLYEVGRRDSLVSNFKSFTVSLWFRQAAPGKTRYPTLIAKGSSADAGNAFVLHTQDHVNKSTRVKFGLTAPAWFGMVSDPVPAGEWHHVAGVYDRTGAATLYIDGVEAGRTRLGMQRAIVDHQVPTTIGADIERGEVTHYFGGELDEIRIRRSACSKSRIKASYQNIRGKDDFVRFGCQHTKIRLDRAPTALREMLRQHPAEVDIRHVPSCKQFNRSEFGHYWRLPATAQLVKAHLRTFGLASTEPSDVDVRKMLAGLPPDWGRLNPKDLLWFTQGLGDDGNVGSWHVLGVDSNTKTLYFFVTSWDYAP